MSKLNISNESHNISPTYLSIGSMAVNLNVSILCEFLFDFQNLMYVLCNILFRLNKKAKYNLEKDLKDKFAALSIDKHNAELKNNSSGIGFKEGVAKIDAT